MELHDLVADGARLECLDTGFLFTEGPVWDPRGFLLFSDMPGDVRRRWAPGIGVTEVRRPANKCNGMAYDATGRLLVCEHSTSRIVREELDGSTTIIASHFDGKELNSPNDVIVSIEWLDPVLRPFLWADGGLRPRARDGARLPRPVSDAGIRSGPRVDRATTSTSPTGCAGPPTSPSCTSTTPLAATSGPSAARRMARWSRV